MIPTKSLKNIYSIPNVMKYRVTYNKRYDLKGKFKDAIYKSSHLEEELMDALRILFNKPKAGDKFYPELFSNIDIPYNEDDDFRYIIISPYNLFYSIKNDKEVKILAFEKCTYTCCT